MPRRIKSQFLKEDAIARAEKMFRKPALVEVSRPLPVAQDAIEIKPIEKVAIVDSPPLLWQRVIAGEKWIGYPVDLLDKVLRRLELADQSVMVRLYRLSWGFKRDTCTVSYAKLAEGCNISRRQAQISVLRLANLKLIEILPKARDTDPSRYRILIPPAIGKELSREKTAIAASATNKEDLKKKDIKEDEKLMDAEEIKRILAEGE